MNQEKAMARGERPGVIQEASRNAGDERGEETTPSAERRSRLHGGEERQLPGVDARAVHAEFRFLVFRAPFLKEEAEERGRVVRVLRPPAAEEGRIGYEGTPSLASRGTSEQVGAVGGDSKEDLEDDVVR
jgi:hypothetical protein